MADKRFQCPQCGKKMSVAGGSTSAWAECPDCHSTFLIAEAPSLDMRFRCPACDSKLVVDRSAAGGFGRCPECQQRIRIPEEAAMPAEEAKPEAAAPAAESPDWKPATLSREEIDHLISYRGKDIGGPAAEPAGKPPRLPRAHSPTERASSA